MRPIFGCFGKFLIYHSSGCRNYSSKREARMFQKLVQQGRKNSKKNHVPSACTLQQYAQYTLCAPESPRKNVLNKIFMDEITELVTTGTYAEQMHDLGVHVSQARITPNYHVLYVYWIHTKDINESEVNDLLRKVGNYLRQELTATGVMGRVPEIRFAIDKDFMRMKLAESILDQFCLLKDENVTDQNLNEQENAATEVEFEFPQMQHDVFGLDYLLIMNKIQNEMIKCGVRSGRDAVESDAQQTQPISKFDKKKLSKILFSNKYTVRKSRSKRREFNSALLESELNPSPEGEFEDWPSEDKET